MMKQEQQKNRSEKISDFFGRNNFMRLNNYFFILKKVFIVGISLGMVCSIATATEPNQVFSIEILPGASAKSPGAYNLPSGLEKLPELSAKIVHSGMIAGIKVNNEALPPVSYLTMNPDVTESADIIMKMNHCGVRLFECCMMSQDMLLEPGKYDFTKMDHTVRRILHLASDSYVIINFRLDNSVGKLLKYMPNEGIGYATGKANTSDHQQQRLIAPSMASEPFKAEVRRYLKAIAEYIRSQPWKNKVAGFRVSYGVYSEWHYFGMTEDMPDTGKAMTKAFRLFLKQHYHTNAELQRAWHQPDVTLETALVPGKAARTAHKGYLLNPGTAERQLLDYYCCHQQEVANMLLSMAGTLKEEFPHRLVGAYFGYMIGSIYPQAGSNAGSTERVLRSPNIDFISSPYPYPTRFRGVGQSGMPRNIPLTAARYGKLAISEADIRTSVAVGDGNRKLISAKTPDEETAVVLRDFANMFFNRSGIQFYHVWHKEGEHCWFNTPAMLDSIKKGIAVWKQLYQAHPPFCPNEAAVVCNFRETGLNGFPTRKQQWGLHYMLMDSTLLAMYASGFPFDLMSLWDFLTSKNNYKLVFFLNAFTLTPEERIALKRKLSPTNHVVWVYAPGLVTKDKFSDQAMSKLTGLKLKHEIGPFKMVVNHEKYGKLSLDIGKNVLQENLRVYSEEPQVEVISHYADNNKIASVRKKLSAGGSVSFAAIPITRGKQIADYFQAAGVHRLTGLGRLVRYQNPYLLYSVGNGGHWKITLPHRAVSATDCFTGEVVARNTVVFSLETKHAKTWLLKIDW